MDDLISRQAAIDAMAELQGRAYTKAELKGISKAWKRIKQLPSAQPEIIRCRDCKFRYTDGENVIANYCLLNHNRAHADDWFCADAEREEE